MKQTDPFRFFGKFKWIDGRRLLGSDEDGRSQNAVDLLALRDRGRRPAQGCGAQAHKIARGGRDQTC